MGYLRAIISKKDQLRIVARAPIRSRMFRLLTEYTLNKEALTQILYPFFEGWSDDAKRSSGYWLHWIYSNTMSIVHWKKKRIFQVWQTIPRGNNGVICFREIQGLIGFLVAIARPMNCRPDKFYYDDETSNLNAIGYDCTTDDFQHDFLPPRLITIIFNNQSIPSNGTVQISLRVILSICACFLCNLNLIVD